MYVKRVYYLNEIGSKKNQEDHIWPRSDEATQQSRVFIVCDGVGGSQNGEIASKIISASLGKLMEDSQKDVSEGTFVTMLNKAKLELLGYARDNGLNNDMATTLTLVVLMSQKAFIGWCGDSRVYHIRNGEIVYKTEDHSLVNSLVRKGEITEEEARNHSKRNIILKAIKADDSPAELESYIVASVMDEDYFLLCSDGLLEHVTDNDITYLLSDKKPAEIDIVTYLLEKCQGKTRDNYSMYLIQVGADVAGPDAKPKKKNVTVLLLLTIILAAAISFIYFSRYPMGHTPGSTVDSTGDHSQSKPKSQGIDTLPEIKIISVDSGGENESSKKAHTEKEKQ